MIEDYLAPMCDDGFHERCRDRRCQCSCHKEES